MNELLDRAQNGRLITTTELKALHESGHVVVARALGIPIEHVSLITDPPSTLYGSSRTPEEGVWTTQAGEFAIIAFTGSQDLAALGTDGDRDSLLEFLQGFRSDRHREAALKHAIEGLPRLIERNKRAIQIVAYELLRRGVVSGKRLDIILSGVLRKHSLWFRAINWVQLQFLRRC